MIEFHDYNPDKPFKVDGEFHDISEGKVILNYTPKEGSVIVTLDGEVMNETSSETPKQGEFYINYAADSEYKTATQQVIFNEADNGKRVKFVYEGVSTLIRAEHLNEIRDFMNHYDEDRATDLVNGTRAPRKNEHVENFKEPKLTDMTEVIVSGTIGTMIAVGSAKDIEEGKTYTITDGTKFEEFTVVSVNLEDNVITAEALENTYESGKIVVSTATFRENKAVVSGDTQIVKWKQKEIWKGREGLVESSKSINSKNSYLDNVSIGENGEIKVEPFPKETVYCFASPYQNYFMEDYNADRKELSIYQAGGDTIIPFNTNQAKEWAFLDGNHNFIPNIPAGLWEPKLKTIKFGSYIHNMYFIPPIWAKRESVLLGSTNYSFVAFSVKEKEGYTLLPPFSDFPEGFYISTNATNYNPNNAAYTPFQTRYARERERHVAFIYLGLSLGGAVACFAPLCFCPRSGQYATRFPFHSYDNASNSEGSTCQTTSIRGFDFDIGKGCFVLSSNGNAQWLSKTTNPPAIDIYGFTNTSTTTVNNLQFVVDKRKIKEE